MKKINLMILFLIVLLILAACTNTQAETAAVIENNKSSDSSEAMSDSMDETMDDTSESMADTKDDTMMEEKDEEMTTGDNHDTMSENEEMMAGDDHEVMSENEDMMAEEDKMVAEEDEMIDMADLPSWQQIALTNARTGESFTLADYSGMTVFVEPMATWCTNCRQQLGNVREARAQISDDSVVFVGLSLETNISDGELAQYQSDFGFDWTFAVMTPELLQQLADTFGRSITSAPSTPHFIIRPDGSYTELVTGIETADQILQNLEAASG